MFETKDWIFKVVFLQPDSSFCLLHSLIQSHTVEYKKIDALQILEISKKTHAPKEGGEQRHRPKP